MYTLTIGCNISNGTFLQMRVLKATASTVAEFKAWLTAQYNAGTPVKVQWELATSTVENLEYEQYGGVTTYYPYTNIFTDSIVQPTLNAKVRVIER